MHLFWLLSSSTVDQDSPFLYSRSPVNNRLFIGSGRILDGVQEVKKISGFATRYLGFFVWLESKVTVLTLFHSFKGFWSNNMVLVHCTTPHLVTTSTSSEKLHFNQLPFHKGLEVSHLEVPWTQDIPMDPCTRMLDFESVIYTIPPFTTWEGDLHDHFGQGLLYHCSFLAQSHWTLELLQLGWTLFLLLPFIHIFLHHQGQFNLDPRFWKLSVKFSGVPLNSQESSIRFSSILWHPDTRTSFYSVHLQWLFVHWWGRWGYISLFLLPFWEDGLVLLCFTPILSYIPI